MNKEEREHLNESFEADLKCLKRRAPYMTEEEYEKRYDDLRRHYFPSNNCLTPKRER